LLAQLVRDARAFPWRNTAITLRERFREDRLGLTSSSLTFTTLIALVPLFSVMLAVFSAFPVFSRLEQVLQRWLLQSLVPPNIAKQVLGYLNQFASKASEIGWVGALVLLFTALALILTMDRKLNDIWRVRQQRCTPVCWAAAAPQSESPPRGVREQTRQCKRPKHQRWLRGPNAIRLLPRSKGSGSTPPSGVSRQRSPRADRWFPHRPADTGNGAQRARETSATGRGGGGKADLADPPNVILAELLEDANHTRVLLRGHHLPMPTEADPQGSDTIFLLTMAEGAARAHLNQLRNRVRASLSNTKDRVLRQHRHRSAEILQQRRKTGQPLAGGCNNLTTRSVTRPSGNGTSGGGGSRSTVSKSRRGGGREKEVRGSRISSQLVGGVRAKAGQARDAPRRRPVSIPRPGRRT
jgi:hypothetical protein